MVVVNFIVVVGKLLRLFELLLLFKILWRLLVKQFV